MKNRFGFDNLRGPAIAITLAAAAFSTATVAADNCGGRGESVGISAESIELEPGRSMVIFASNGSISSENSPNNANGKCGGYAIPLEGGKTRMVGTCARKTKNGDVWVDEWVLEPGTDRGVWKLVYGTGVFAGKKWTGWWKTTSDDGKVLKYDWGGTCD